MKKILLILLFFPLISFGQDKSFELGLLFGGSFNSLNGEAFNSNLSHKYKRHLRPLGGVLAQYNFSNRFSLKSKLLYHIKGEQTRLEAPPHIAGFYNIDGSGDNRTDLHYITLPLLAQFNFGKNRWGFFCNTGLYLSSLIKEKTFYNGKEFEGNTIYGLENYSKKLDFGLIL